MTPLANILVATDFSPRVGRAVDRAARLAHEHRATLHLLHVMDKLLLQMFTGSIDEYPLATEQRLLDSARSRLKDLAGHLAAHFGVAVRHELLIGRVHSQVAQYAVTHGVGLSVFGAHGENFVRDLFMGSTVAKFLRKGRQPTLVVRSEDKQPYREVLVAVDFSPASRLAIEAQPQPRLTRAWRVAEPGHQRDACRQQPRGLAANVLQARDRFVSDAIAVDAGLNPEVVHAEIGQYAERGKAEPAACFDGREQGGRMHGRSHHHIGREDPQTRVQPPREAHPAPFDQRTPHQGPISGARAWEVPRKTCGTRPGPARGGHRSIPAVPCQRRRWPRAMPGPRPGTAAVPGCSPAPAARCVRGLHQECKR